MTDEILGILKDSKCPKCGSKKVFCLIQYPLIVKVDMQGKIVRTNKRTGKRMKLSNEYMAREFLSAMQDIQVAQYKCDKCGWTSKSYTP